MAIASSPKPVTEQPSLEPGTPVVTDIPEWVTPAEAAFLAAVHESQIIWWIETGLLESVPIFRNERDPSLTLVRARDLGWAQESKDPVSSGEMYSPVDHVDRGGGSMLEAIDARLHEIATRAGATFDDVLAFLESQSGRRARATLATGLIVSVPLVMRVPGLRRSAIGRAIEVVGGATLVVKLAELIRDWERRRPSVEAPRA